jgi:hypothetical protein
MSEPSGRLHKKEIDLQFIMLKTGAWKQDVDSKNVVVAVAWVLQLFEDVHPMECELITAILESSEYHLAITQQSSI